METSLLERRPIMEVPEEPPRTIEEEEEEPEVGLPTTVGEPPPPASPEPVSLLPACPHCGERPAKIATALTMVTIGGALGTVGQMPLLTLFCGNPECQKIFNFVPMAIQQNPPLPSGLPPGVGKHRLGRF